MTKNKSMNNKKEYRKSNNRKNLKVNNLKNFYNNMKVRPLRGTF